MNYSATNTDKKTVQTDQTPKVPQSVQNQAKYSFPFSITFGMFFYIGIFCLLMGILVVSRMPTWQ